jgi:DNA polymerase type B, organellar and viral
VVRLSDASFARNRASQRKRNITHNARRARTEGRLNSDINRMERRPFIGWDGEGYNAYVVDSSGEIDTQHRYMLFGCSIQQYISGIDLGTRECLDTILYVERQFPDAFHVGFAFEYDVNMILRDLEWRYLAVLHDTGVVKWRGYRIKHTPHKSFSISKNGISATIYDVFGFFHCSYVRALKKYNIGTKEQLSHIETGKNNRSKFTYSEIEAVVVYWSHEISLLPSLMDSLRESCYTAGFFITQWHGPGALASFALKKYHVLDWKGVARNVPKAVQHARRLAYAGGRFQAWKCGIYKGPVYTADINSAYAYACSLLPRLDKGFWRKVDPKTISSPRDISHFALYRIRFDASEMETSARDNHIPFPLFHRDEKGYLSWPSRVENWYWSPEAALVAGSKYAEFLECWEFVDNGERPFDFVRTAFERRVQLQMVGDPVEKAYKWFLASIYGQFAQRVGWDRNRRSAPRSHQLEWAGFITSYCRAMVFRAAIHIARQGGLISIDTDGVTSSVPFDPAKLATGVGTGLGEWKLEDYSEILFWQNGIYWLRKPDGTWEDPKTRGIPRGTISLDSAREALSAHRDSGKRGNPAIRLSRNRFIGYRQALSSQFGKWRNWYSESVDVTFGGAGKGKHIPAMCKSCNTDDLGRLHTIIHFPPKGLVSKPHKLPWLEDKPEELKNVTDKGIWEDSTL